MRPLEGILVLDFSTLLPGPLATLMLAEAGAEVVKVERPGTGEEMRAYVPRWGRDSINFALLNRGKKSIAVDLKNPEDRAALEPLLRRADVVVEQFRPGVMQRLGLDHASVARANPGVVYCSITSYGQTGPNAQTAAHDLNFIAECGLLALSSGPAQSPVVPPVLIGDIGGGTYPAVMNILLALHARRATGRGQHLDIAMVDNLFTFMYWALGNGFATGVWPGNGTELTTGGTPRYRLYPTADGGTLAAAPIEQKFWDEFCDVIGLEQELRDDSLDPERTAQAVARIIASRPAEAWAARFAGRDCCCSIVTSLQDAVRSTQATERGIFARRITNEEGGELPALPTPVDRAFQGEGAAHAPALGEHNAEYLRR